MVRIKMNNKYYMCPNCAKVFYVGNKSEYKYKTNKILLCSYTCKSEFIKKNKIIKKIKLGE